MWSVSGVRGRYSACFSAMSAKHKVAVSKLKWQLRKYGIRAVRRPRRH